MPTQSCGHGTLLTPFLSRERRDMPEPTIQQLFDLTGKTALITGGTGHLGSAFSRALAEAGASVILSSRFQDKAEAAVAALPVVGAAKHIPLSLDHMKADTLDERFAEAVKKAG